MRRRLGKFLPIVLLALAVQILAPIAACWAAGAGASDPLQGAVICHGAATTTPDSTDRTGHPAHDGSCSLCCAAHSSPPLDTPRVAFVVLTRQPEKVVWLEVTPEHFNARAGSHAQARAPPSIS